jgi:enolase
LSATSIATVNARQVFDSRGRPTVEAEVRLVGGASGRASSPSGASRGAAEVWELRDGDPAHFGGLGVGKAVASVNAEIGPALIARDGLDQIGLDALLRQLDGTPQLTRLGGNAILAVSIAAARAGAEALGKPLWRRLSELSGGAAPPSMPLPMVNLLSGGLHASRGMDVQDFLVMPIGAATYSEALEWALRIRAAAAKICEQRAITTLLADEGGLSPGFADSDQALELMVRAIERAGLRPGVDAAIALDIAASALMDDQGRYVFQRAGKVMDAGVLMDLLENWAARWPIVSIEDGLGEEDWAHWPELTRRLGHLQLIGDDLFATQADRVARGAREGSANAALIKINQNGTLTGTFEAIAAARAAGFATVISARSGETEDAFIADLAVGVGGGQIKIGSVRGGERMAKYNQLLRLEAEGLSLAMADRRLTAPTSMR